MAGKPLFKVTPEQLERRGRLSSGSCATTLRRRHMERWRRCKFSIYDPQCARGGGNAAGPRTGFGGATRQSPLLNIVPVKELKEKGPAVLARLFFLNRLLEFTNSKLWSSELNF